MSDATTFGDVLNHIRKISGGEAKKLGDLFELLMVEFFSKDRQYAHFKEVRRVPIEKDRGIDIIAYDGFGEPYAIQCKFLADGTSLHYEGNVTNLWVESEVKNIKNRIIVTTGEPTKTLVKQCAETGVTIIRRTDLETSKIKWDIDPKKITQNATLPLRPYQETAYNKVIRGFQNNSRGQLIMACGTGKTLTSLRIAEEMVGKDKTVLYLVPSISLIKQTYNAWAENFNIPQQTIIVCSDKTAGNPEDISITGLTSGIVTTDPNKLRNNFQKLKNDKKSMRVIFSTYQSADVVQEAFHDVVFDLIIFDEAHRTAGSGKKAFTLAHDDENISARKRLYMTATPRVYELEGDNVFSMNDKEIFGPEFHKLPFSKAITDGILTEYQVVGLAIDADEEDKKNVDADIDSEIPLEEECKLASVYSAIKQQDVDEPPNLLNRILVFHNKIPNSKRFIKAFKKVVDIENERNNQTIHVDTQHVDGKDRAKDRVKSINWLENTSEDTVHVLSNVRCLSEGVDVPSLDGVVFYEPRQSVVDVVQAVGRVIRTHPSKKMGYVIVPVVVSKNEAISSSADKSKANKLILQVLEALRAHDDRIDKFFNQASLVLEPGEKPSRDKIENMIDIPPTIRPIFDVLPATLLDTGFYWEEYGRKLGERAAVVALRLANRADTKYKQNIETLHENLKETVGYTVTYSDTIQAVAQHVVLQPIFRELFGETTNPVITAFNNTVGRMDFHVELEELEEWHKLMKYHIGNINSPAAKQNIINKIYGNFFQTFDRAQAKTIVYTPVVIVDFIINSIQHVLKEQFNAGFGDKKISILDPFAGTGVFLTRLLDMLPKDVVKSKYKDIRFGENKLLAYYTACMNIETTYSRIVGEDKPFERSCYVDTFTVRPNWLELKASGRAEALEQTKITDPDFKDVFQMRDEQRSARIQVIIGNPPYSAGQKSANDDNKNVSHPELEGLVKDTYIKHAPKGNKRSLYNSYLKALRWASDRIGESGIIGFIMPSAWITGNAEAGVRACIKEEFTDVYCFNLRGNQQGTRGEQSRREGGKIFGGGSREATTIVILVKNPSKTGCTIRYHDIGDHLSREQKFDIIRGFGDMSNVPWLPKSPDKYHDWLNQRGELADEWDDITPMGSRAGKGGKKDNILFSQYCSGLKTRRDPWVYNSSRGQLTSNMKRTIDYCNTQDPTDFKIDEKHVQWTPHLSRAMKKSSPLQFNDDLIRQALFRPFFKQYLYFDKAFANDTALIPRFYPTGEANNPSILVPDKIRGEFSTMMTNTTPDLHIHEASQTFPLKAKKQNRENVRQGVTPDSRLQTPDSRLQTPPEANLAIIVPDKIRGEFSVFITNMTPDLEVVHHGQVFPMKVMEK
ncbi:MAG: DEAD/DEAH box helicase [Cenarchaeum sp. SB0663_bin_5]|nr:DEAD/DEAH box helicase [Cenarchaeum sp. SB0663_bin_5]